jgi:hypothetical protein
MPVSTLKRIAWTLPAFALVIGAVAVANGFTGVVTGSDLVAPIDGPVSAGQIATSPTAVDGENWTAMRVKGSARF